MLEGWRATLPLVLHAWKEGREARKERKGRKEGKEGTEGDLTLYSVYLLSAYDISKHALTRTIQAVITRAIILMCRKIILERILKND